MKIKLTLPVVLAAGIFASGTFISKSCSAQTSKDTLRVMVYNVLGFGTANSNNCQTPLQTDLPPLYADLKAIVQFANADIIGLDKMQCVQTSLTDPNGLSGVYFPDTVIAECMDAVWPGRYGFAPFTDLSDCKGGSSELVFFDQTKLHYVSTVAMDYGQEDFDMFKFYYNSPYLTPSTDTTYIYVILCHTISGSSEHTGRDGEDSVVMNKLRTMFTTLPNLIYMGDLNTRTSTEEGYSYLTQSSNGVYNLADPPFHPDAKLTYPCDWNSSNAYQAYYTTTTRSTTLPNSCGVTGGAKDWYDHILLSPSLISGTDNITYIKDSYKTIGNDGARAGISVNAGTNNSAPTNVINALFNFSDKFPVEVSMAVNPILGVRNIQSDQGSIKINNPVGQGLIMHFAEFLNGQNITMGVYDICGRNLYQSSFNITSSTISKDILLTPGIYFIHFSSGGYTTTIKVVKEY